jgi:hypothetical protein
LELHYLMNNKNATPSLAILAFFTFASYLIPFHHHPYRSYYNDASAIVGVIIALSWIGFQSKAVLRVPSSVVLPLMLIVIIGLQTFHGMLLFPIDSVFPILYLISFALALILGATCAAQPDGLRKVSFTLAATFIVSGLLSVFFQFVQLVNLNWYPYVMPLLHDRAWRPFANLGQPNLLALLLSFSITSCWYLYVTRQMKATLSLSFAVFLLLGLVLTQARICWVVLPMLLVLCWHQPAECPKVSKLALSLLLVLYIALVIYTPDLLKGVGIVLETVEERAGQTSVRQVLWEQGWTISLLHPWFGAGWFQFGAQQAMLSPLFPPTEYSDYAHNIVLDLASEIGWPLTVIIFLAAAYWFYQCCIRQWKSLPVRYMSMMLLAISAHSLVEYPLWYGYILMPFGVMIGALSVAELGWRDVMVNKKGAAAFFLSSALLISAITWDHNRVVNGFVALVWQQAGQKSGIGSTERPEFTLFPQFYDYFRVAKLPIGPGMPKEDIQFLERVSLRFAFTPILGRLAIAYAENQRPTEALQVLIAIHRLDDVDYPRIYAHWKTYAEKNPGLYGEIFKRMPLSEGRRQRTDGSQ